MKRKLARYTSLAYNIAEEKYSRKSLMFDKEDAWIKKERN